MGKYYDKLGFVQTREIEPGIWSPVYEERLYAGDVTMTSYAWNDGNRINGDLEINHTVSVIADSFIIENFFALRYVNYLGRRWAVRKAELRVPRLILTLGSEYIIEEGGTYDRITSDQESASCHTT